MINVIYVVGEANLEYNDEYYFTTGGTTPKKFFNTLEEAREARNEMNLHWVKNWGSLRDLGYNMDEVFQNSDYMLEKYGIDDIDDLDAKNYNDEQLLDIVSQLRIEPFAIYKVERGE